MSKRRVVVTGMGMVSPYGLNVEETWRSVVEGKSAIGLIQEFDTTLFPAKIAAEILNFDCSQYFSGKDSRKMDIFVQYGAVAGAKAFEDAGLEVNEGNAHRIGVAIGSGIGGLNTIQNTSYTLRDSGPRRISPFFIPSAIINMVAGYVSMMYGLRGPNISIVTACTTGAHNIAMATRLIQYGDADVMLAGGAEKSCTQLALGGFSAARALSTRNDDPTRASRPWDKDRDGFVLGDGAGVIVLEELEHALKRGARIYAELTGLGMSGDAHHITTPPENGQGAVDAMMNALNDADLAPQDIGYINAHGTSTHAGDQVEAFALNRVFGTHHKGVAVSSTKSMTGHLLGAAGGVESIFSILALRDQVAPPTINLDNLDVESDLNFVPHTAQERKIDHVLSNSFGFGGTNGSLIFSKFLTARGG